MNLEDLYRILRTSHAQAQGIVDTIGEPLIVLDERGCVVDANRAFFGTFLVERDDTIGKRLIDLGTGQWNIPELSRLVSEIIPNATAVIDYEVTHEFPNIGKRTFLLTARRLWKADNNSTQILLVFNDVTDTRQKEQESSLLFSEMRHRLTNLLGVVRAIANQTETEGRTAEEYKATFLGRFGALLEAQSLMSAGRAAVQIKDLVSSVAAGLGGGRLHVAEGPPVLVAEQQILPLTMIFHELGTNALKHGAFSDEGGAVHVSWEIMSSQKPHALRLVWRETCSAPVGKPARTSVGTEVIKNSATLGLHGSVELDFRERGFRRIVSLSADRGR